MIEFQVKKKTACYVVGVVPDLGLHIAIAKASVGADEESMITVSISEDQLLKAYTFLNVQAEGVSSDINAELNASLLPIVMQEGNEEIAGKIQDILTRNIYLLEQATQSGLDKVNTIQAALAGNS